MVKFTTINFIVILSIFLLFIACKESTIIQQIVEKKDIDISTRKNLPVKNKAKITGFVRFDEETSKTFNNSDKRELYVFVEYVHDYTELKIIHKEKFVPPKIFFMEFDYPSKSEFEYIAVGFSYYPNIPCSKYVGAKIYQNKITDLGEIILTSCPVLTNYTPPIFSGKIIDKLEFTSTYKVSFINNNLDETYFAHANSVHEFTIPFDEKSVTFPFLVKVTNLKNKKYMIIKFSELSELIKENYQIDFKPNTIISGQVLGSDINEKGLENVVIKSSNYNIEVKTNKEGKFEYPILSTNNTKLILEIGGLHDIYYDTAIEIPISTVKPTIQIEPIILQRK